MAPFSPHAVKSLIPKTTEICNELIDAFAGKTHFDGAVDYAQHIPVRVISHMLGLPDEDGDTFRNWVRQIVIEGITDVDAAQRGLDAVTDYFRQQIAQREKHLTDDLISQIMQFRYEDGAPFKENHVLGTLRLILVAGIDTTWSNIGASVWHLAQTPTDRKRLIDEPDLIASAVEELLRAFSPVTMARLVAKDKEVNGCLFKQGDMVLLPFPAANRDPSKFKDANKVILDRADNRHAAFGLGIHRCIGAYLARMEMTVAIQQLLKRVPDFQLAGETTWSQGPIRGPRGLPIAIG
jgi:cytochrome P450